MNEEALQRACINWFVARYANRYPIFTDLGGVRLTPGLAARAARLRNRRGYPDLFIPVRRNVYGGLFVELKSPARPYALRDGSLPADAHLEQQLEVMLELQSHHFLARFVNNYEHFVTLVEWYMELFTPVPRAVPHAPCPLQLPFINPKI